MNVFRTLNLPLLPVLLCSAPAFAAPSAEPSAQEPAPVQAESEEAEEERRRRIQKLFGKLMGPLTRASEAYDRHEDLEESSWFSEDQKDNQKRIDRLLDQAMRLLEVGGVAETRTKLRSLEQEIDNLRARILKDREALLSAPSKAELNRLERTYTTTKEELQARIDKANKTIEARYVAIEELEARFVTELRSIGVEISLESARSLLSSVAGDDFVSMCVVFDNMRGVTQQLQELTEKSGESLDAARRYYGSYLVLVRLMDRIQKDFVHNVNEVMIPELKQYRKDAEALIRAAKDNLARGGNRSIGRQNIASNELTIRATGLYVEYLKQQASEVKAANKDVQVNLRDAINTYETVLLSSQVAQLLREGSQNFEALLELDVPELKGFDNAELRAEFERLTTRLSGID